jgi:hypothetical protein
MSQVALNQELQNQIQQLKRDMPKTQRTPTTTTIPCKRTGYTLRLNEFRQKNAKRPEAKFYQAGFII